MKKISIVTPVYNEEKSIARYYDAIQKIEYPHENFEIIIVDDGSDDATHAKLEEIQKNSTEITMHIITLPCNKGRAIARETGVRAAHYENILLLDAKCEIGPDALTFLNEATHDVINSTTIPAKNSIYDRFFYLMRDKIYNSNEQNETIITKKNFDTARKGTTCLFCKKDIFLSAQIENKEDKNSSDDTKLLWNIVQSENIITSPSLKVTYNTRTTLLENIRHIFNRGPKFIDYYYKPGKRYYISINIALFVTIVSTGAIIYKTTLMGPFMILAFIIDCTIALYCKEKWKDVLIVTTLLPIFIIAFWAGIIKGLILKIARSQ